MMPRRVRIVCCSWLFFVALSADPIASGAPDPHVRAVDPAIVETIRAGELRSPLFKAFVAALDATDVVVYVAFGRQLPRGTGGQVTFGGAAGGRRYLRIAIRPDLDRDRQIELLGHELRHALEIAGAPDVVNAATLAELYRRIGFQSGPYGCNRYDSDAAITAGHAVARELGARVPQAATP